MSHALLDFIKAWTSHHNAERILEEGPTLPDAADAQVYLDSLSPEDRARIEQDLQKAVQALEVHLTGLKSEASDIKRQLNQTNQITKACLTYARTPTRPPTD
jgi:chaperonin cofactor prefoldin